jgi:hypothetical protein
MLRDMEQVQLFITDDFKCKTPFESQKDSREKRGLCSCYKNAVIFGFSYPSFREEF